MFRDTAHALATWIVGERPPAVVMGEHFAPANIIGIYRQGANTSNYLLRLRRTHGGMLVAHTLLQVLGQKLRQGQSQIRVFTDRVVDGKGQVEGKGKGKGRGRGLGEGRGRGAGRGRDPQRERSPRGSATVKIKVLCCDMKERRWRRRLALGGRRCGHTKVDIVYGIRFLVRLDHWGEAGRPIIMEHFFTKKNL